MPKTATGGTAGGGTLPQVPLFLQSEPLLLYVLRMAGNLPPPKSPDTTSQGPSLQAGRSEENSLVPALLSLFRTEGQVQAIS